MNEPLNILDTVIQFIFQVNFTTFKGELMFFVWSDFILFL